MSHTKFTKRVSIKHKIHDFVTMYLKATACCVDKSGVEIPGHGISTKRRGRKSCQQIHSVKESFCNERDYYSIPVIFN